jgi:oligoribonuclease
MRQFEFIWFDLETTGLNNAPEFSKPGDLYAGGHVLEFAAVVAADDREGDLLAVDEVSGVIHHVADDLKMSEFVHSMHTRNGLLAEVEASTLTLAAADQQLADFCESLGVQPRGVSLAGNSVHFDLSWARVHMPRFASFLSHRVFDVSTLLRAGEAWIPGYKKEKAEAHRALDDVLESLYLARKWRKAAHI